MRPLMEGDSPFSLGNRSAGDPFPQYYRRRGDGSRLTMNHPLVIQRLNEVAFSVRTTEPPFVDVLLVDTVNETVTVTGAFTATGCPFNINTANGACDPVVTIGDSTAGTPYTYLQFGTLGTIDNSIGSSLRLRATLQTLFLGAAVGTTITSDAGDIDILATGGDINCQTLQQILLSHGTGVVVDGDFASALHVQNLANTEYFNMDTSNGSATIHSDSSNALLVETAAGTTMLNVNTVTSYVEVGTPGSGQLAVGGYNPSAPSSSHGFHYGSQKIFQISGAGQEAIWFDPQTDTMLFGGNFSSNLHTFQFLQSALFKGYFAWQRTTFTTSTVLPQGTTTTYVGYTGSSTPGVVNVTLPLATISNAGAITGTVLVVADEIGLAAPTHYLNVVGAGGQLISGAPSTTVDGGSAAFLLSTGTGWQQFS